MRHRLNDFEACNAAVLADWNGDRSRLAGAEGLVAHFLDGPGQA